MLKTFLISKSLSFSGVWQAMGFLRLEVTGVEGVTMENTDKYAFVSRMCVYFLGGYKKAPSIKLQYSESSVSAFGRCGGAREAKLQASNIQAPMKHQARKHQPEVQSLELLWMLDVVIWSFRLRNDDAQTRQAGALLYYSVSYNVRCIARGFSVSISSRHGGIYET